MLKTIVKNGVIVDVQDTCSTLQEAIDEVQVSIMISRDSYIEDVWRVMKYDYEDLVYAKKGEAPTAKQKNYDKLVSECTKEYNRLISILNSSKTNLEAYSVCWTAIPEGHQEMVDSNSNGIFDILERLFFRE